MKLDTTKILLIAAITYIGWLSFFKAVPVTPPEPVTITIPPTSGTTGIVDIEPEVIIDTVYVKGDVVEVDKGYKELYEKAKDSLAKQELYLDAIAIRKYSDTIVDNKEITIKGEATTRGSLLNYSVDYTIKEKEFTYTPEVVSVLPRLTAGIGLELGIPTVPNTSFVAKGTFSLMNRRGREITVGYDTEARVWLGGKLNIKLIK